MHKNLIICTALGFLAAFANVQGGERAFVDMQTTYGTVTVKLDIQRAPVSTENFLRYVDEGFYEGTVFHRVIKGFMDQGGGYDDTLTEKATHEPIILESDNGLKNLRGTIAMARTNVPDSATSQFFINTVDNPFLDFNGSAGVSGYAVFGKIVRGMKVIDLIADLPKVSPDSVFARTFPDLPQWPVYIDATYRYQKLTPESPQIRIKLLGEGSGKVFSQDLGINCSITKKRCARNFPKNSQVSLVARPAAGSVFAAWTGDCYGGDLTKSNQQRRYVIKNVKFNVNCAARFNLQ